MPRGLLRYKKQGRQLPCFYYTSLTSTNAVAAELARQGKIESGAIIAARMQTAGRGRFSRGFLSAKDMGIYLTYVRKLEKDADVSAFGGLSALAVCSFLEDNFGIDARIKWPNDVLANGRKICGILPENIAGAGGNRFLIVGAGVNIFYAPEDFGELADRATSVFIELSEGGSEDKNLLGRFSSRRRFIANLCFKLGCELDDFGDRFLAGDEALISQYREKCETLGKTIKYKNGEQMLTGIAVGVEEDCSLIVRDESGHMHAVRWGEVLQQI